MQLRLALQQGGLVEDGEHRAAGAVDRDLALTVYRRGALVDVVTRPTELVA